MERELKMYSRAEGEYPSKDKLGRFRPYWRRCGCSPLPSREVAGYTGHSHCETKNNPVGHKWAQAGRWAHGGEETMWIEPLLHRVKTGFLAYPTALSPWDTSLFVPMRLRTFVTQAGHSPVLSGAVSYAAVAWIRSWRKHVVAKCCRKLHLEGT